MGWGGRGGREQQHHHVNTARWAVDGGVMGDGEGRGSTRLRSMYQHHSFLSPCPDQQASPHLLPTPPPLHHLLPTRPLQARTARQPSAMAREGATLS
ncbi:hypothetical protein E2C01_083350 [Portunus trituberculatus]|uniref:Uncharacterized protein n=1 Tax=Portunus trituberculatus TaxID=210409 RepID=A0A5B7J4E9_PORTR|nr:hypothetical protein [Portunus trituberculatus]